MTTRLPRDKLEPAAIELYAKGYDFDEIAARQRRIYGSGARCARTYMNWRSENDAWDRARGKHARNTMTDVTVKGDLDRLRRARERADRLLNQEDELSSAQSSELKLMMSVAESLQKKIDPDGVLQWLEQFMQWVRENASPEDLRRVAELGRQFGENVFDLIDEALSGPQVALTQTTSAQREPG